MQKPNLPSNTSNPSTRRPKAASGLSRRSFIRASAAFGAFSIVPPHVVLGKKSGTGVAPSDRVNLAVIGIGNQGNGDRKSFLGSGICNVVALCDVDMEGRHTHEARYVHQLTDKPPARKKNQAPPERLGKAKGFTDFRKMFDFMAGEIDAVQVSLPDHSHFAATMLAMSLGKHVFVEKPLCHTFGQGERLMDLARRSKVVTQMGNQGHSGANFFQFKAWMEGGVIKDVTRITAFMNKSRRWHGWGATVTEYPSEPVPSGLDWDQWIDSAPEHPFSRKLHPQEWRSWFDYGSGCFGGWGAHILGTCHRFLKLGYPNKIAAVYRDGANPLVFPQASTIRFDFPARDGMPPCTVTWYDGVDNLPKEEPEIVGEIGKDPGKIIYAKDLVFRGGTHSDPLRIVPREKFIEMRESLPTFPQKNSNHYANFLLACKGEEESRSPFDVSGPLSQVFNLGVIAQRLGGELEFDTEQKRITNNEAANALLDPAPRKGWEEFHRL